MFDVPRGVALLTITLADPGDGASLDVAVIVTVAGFGLVAGAV